MGDDMTEQDPPETPIQRALRLKQAILDAKPKPPKDGLSQSLTAELPM